MTFCYYAYAEIKWLKLDLRIVFLNTGTVYEEQDLIRCFAMVDIYDRASLIANRNANNVLDNRCRKYSAAKLLVA